MAVLPFENLTPDASVPWLAAAGQAMAITALAESKAFTPVAVSAPGAASAAQASRALHGYLTRDQRGLVVHFWLEDLESRRMIQTAEAAGAEGDLLANFEAALRQVAPGAGSFGTSTRAALEAWGAALQARNPQQATASLEEATQADPDFGQAWLLLAQTRLARGDREGALAMARKAAERESLRGSRERAQLQVFAATLAGDESLRLKALEHLAAEMPDDIATLTQLADAQVRQQKFADAALSYERAARVDGAPPTLWNTLGYVRARAGDLNKAVEALTRYRETGDAANALDSLGEVHFEHGRFVEAIRYFEESYKSNPRAGVELQKGAFAALLAGDAARAQSLFEQYLKTQHSGLEEQQAQWDYLNGKRKEARAAVEQASRSGAALPFAHSLAILWHLEAGDRAAAAAAWERLAKSAPGAWAAVAQLFAVALDKAPPQNPAQEAYAAIFRRDFEQAAARWSGIAGQSNSVTASLAYGLAANSRRAARQPPAAFAELYPLPPPGLDAVMITLLYPEFLRAREEWLRAAGRNAEAESVAAAYRKLRGEGRSFWDPAR